MASKTRVYVPVTLRMLGELVKQGELVPISRTAFAVTPTLREAYAFGDDDELSEIAIAEAARASIRLLSIEAQDLAEGDDVQHSDNHPTPLPLRRAVLAADVNEPILRPDLDDAVVRVAAPILISEVASVHVDLAEAESALVRAVAVIDAADLGDEDAELAVGDAQDHELAWYATQEIPFLLDLL
ncbi:MAG: DUF6912 family protein [Mycobacteriaceae bacterium]